MKKICFFFVAFFLFATSFGSSVILTPTPSPVPSTPNASKIYLPLGLNGQKVSLLDLSKMKIKDYQKFSGQHLSLFDKIRFKFAQKKLRNSINADGTVNSRALQDFTKSSAGGGGKSQVIALLLVILVGGLGIHRFYLGYTWQGIVQLLTLGGCGIWALIDMIRIITGDLQPKDGEYEKTL